MLLPRWLNEKRSVSDEVAREAEQGSGALTRRIMVGARDSARSTLVGSLSPARRRSVRPAAEAPMLTPDHRRTCDREQSADSLKTCKAVPACTNLQEPSSQRPDNYMWTELRTGIGLVGLVEVWWLGRIVVNS